MNYAGEAIDEASFNSALGAIADTEPRDALLSTETKKICDVIATIAAIRTLHRQLCADREQDSPRHRARYGNVQ